MTHKIRIVDADRPMKSKENYDGVERRCERRVREDAEIARRWKELRRRQAALEEWVRQREVVTS